MPVCARAIQQPDGSFLLGLDPSETNPSTCAYVVDTGTESLIGSLAAMSPSDALVIAGAASVVWAGAWALRVLRDAIITSTQESSDESS